MNRSLLIIITGFMLAFILGSLLLLQVLNADNPIQVHVSLDPADFPTPAPTHTPHPTATALPPTLAPNQGFRGMATVSDCPDSDPAVTWVCDSTTGMDAVATTDDNPNPLDSSDLSGRYSWVDASNFRPAERVSASHHQLVLPPCLDAGDPAQRYFFTEPATLPALQSLDIGGLNQLNAWLLLPDTFDFNSVSHRIYASGSLLDCQVVAGQTMEVYP